MDTDEVIYHPYITFNLVDYDDDEEWESCLCVRFLDPTTMEMINEFRFEDPDSFAAIVDALGTAAEQLRTLVEDGFAAVVEEFGLDHVATPNLDDDITVQDILDAGSD